MKVKAFSLVLGWLLLSASVVSAQKITVSGKVIDSETKEPLPFASLGIIGKPIGVIANEQGEFDFHIPVDYRNDFLSVSMLGYQPHEVPVWSVTTDQPVVIELQAAAVLLKEVVISDSLKAGEIVRLALAKIEDNYPMKPFQLDGFYRDVKKMGGTYISLLEAAVKIYDENYQAPRNKFKLRERVALKEVRRSLGYSSRFTSFFDKDNLLEDLLLNNNIRYRQFPDEDIFFKQLKREGISTYQGHTVFVISLKKDYFLRIYIDRETYGIVRLEYENDHQEKLEKMRGLESRFVKIKRTIDFKLFEGKLYLNYLSVTSQVNWYEHKTGKLKFETELFRQLLVNHVYPNPPERIGLWQKMRNYGLQYQDQPYNKEFWDHYNVIKESPLDKKIIEDLGKEIPLEKQFKDN
ncbi:MAG: carboxypeptidase-like regulatory domain-containing protein [Bacteroidetes bacterium]|nr:carboxypeptidase-like regulatory domain-containing protein [Bacteroidota bacterium]MBS1540441.1 carboxypeptidase-like regulatory domain-containing protein [Bacteroidota bacterium]